MRIEASAQFLGRDYHTQVENSNVQCNFSNARAELFRCMERTHWLRSAECAMEYSLLGALSRRGATQRRSIAREATLFARLPAWVSCAASLL